MGKAGEKQKRRPKFKDKKQSERFKKTAQEIGADASSDDVDRILEAMTDSLRKAVTAKYESYRHKIYNSQLMYKPLGTPFPPELVRNDWKRIAKMTDAPEIAMKDIETKGFYITQVDMSKEYGSEDSQSDSKH
jgi:hypothetical protein